MIDSYTIALFTAILLQAMLKATLAIEHRIAAVFVDRSGPRWMTIPLLATWVLLFGSKLVILGAVDVVVGDHVELGLKVHSSLSKRQQSKSAGDGAPRAGGGRRQLRCAPRTGRYECQM